MDRGAALNLGGGGAALLFLLTMSFTYQLGANPSIDYVRLLVSDTQSTNHIFEDEEITIATNISNGVWQSGMKYSGAGGLQNLPVPPTSYLRVAALLLDSLAANKSRLASIKQILDVRLDATDAAKELRATAAEYRQTDDESGAFAIIEQVHTVADFKDRFWKQVQRQSGA